MGILKRVLLALACAFGCTGCTSILFFPTRELFMTPKEWGIEYEEVMWRVEEERVHGWLMKSPNPMGTVVVLHGNAENRSTHFQSVAWLLKSHFNVLIFDYRGFADSEGSASVPDAIDDASGALRYLSEHDGLPIAVLGQSIGGAIAVCAVAEQQDGVVKALVVEGAPVSYRHAARDALRASWVTSIFSWPLSFAVSDRMAAWRCASRVQKIPVAVIHSRDDSIVPFHHFERLLVSLSGTEVLPLEVTGSHLSAFAKPETRDSILKFLQKQMRATGK